MKWRWALVVFAISGIAFGQDDLSPGAPSRDKPKPSEPAKPARKKEAKPAPQEPVAPAKPTEPPAAPELDAESICESSGGEWRNGECNMERKWCLEGNHEWDELQRRCIPKVHCPEGSHEKDGICVRDVVEPEMPEAPVSPEAEVPEWDEDAVEVVDDDNPWESTTQTIDLGGGYGESWQGATGGTSWGSVALWTGIGLGVVGAGTGLWVLSKSSSVVEDCEDKVCPSYVKKDWDRTRAVGNISTGSFIAGGVLIGLGLIGLSVGDGEGSKGLGVGMSGRGVEVGHRWVF